MSAPRSSLAAAVFAAVLAGSIHVGSAPLVQAAPTCDRVPTGVEASDYTLDFTMPPHLMPDAMFDGRPATIRVHRVTPAYAHGRCPGVQTTAMVLVHGRSIPGSSTFDLRHPTSQDPGGGAFSLQEALARSGIDTFAPDLLGYGKSTRFPDGLDDPANASLPAYGADNSCATPEVGCDRTRNAAIFPLNQQARYLGDGKNPPIDGLGVNPLHGEMRKHTSGHYFATTDVWARDILQVIDDAIAKARPRADKVAVLGYSLGGARVARALYRLGEHANRKVSRILLVASVFNRLPGVPGDVNLPTEEADLPELERSTSFPLAIGRTGGWDGVPPDRESVCTGRVPVGGPQDLQRQVLDLDPLGKSWGGSDPAHPSGVYRLPTFTNYGWNPTVAATFTVPTLILQGSDDLTNPPANADNIFDSLTGVANKVMVKIECGGHFMHSEGCADARCDDHNDATIPYGQTAQTWLGPHSTVAAALTEWVEHGTFDGKECGRFAVNASGIAAQGTTTGCPA
ncbi:alpha/beta fold hydrolase [Nocardia sp. CA-136227]|uniref:alpha/beta fold hydrolase n=1 Tax=Nocardia sp. CA-136227 TaxID=3239979 RepID=UPI003D97A6B2